MNQVSLLVLIRKSGEGLIEESPGNAPILIPFVYLGDIILTSVGNPEIHQITEQTRALRQDFQARHRV